MKLPFPIRGSEEWDEREFHRRSMGCKCISLGEINRAENDWAPIIARPIQFARVMPNANRLAELKYRQSRRHLSTEEKTR